MTASPGSEVERVYREEGARLWRAVFLYANDPEVASDAVAEAFAQALRRGEGIKSVKAWVWRVAFRVAAGDMKDRRRRSGELPEIPYEMPEPAEAVRSALAKLSPKQRGAVVLHHVMGYPLRDAARILDSTAGAVQVHLVRGRRRLRELLEDDDG